MNKRLKTLSEHLGRITFFNGEMQSNTPAELRSRIISIYFFVMYGGMALGNMVTGQLLSMLSAKIVFMIFGGCLILLGVTVTKINRSENVILKNFT